MTKQDLNQPVTQKEFQEFKQKDFQGLGQELHEFKHEFNEFKEFAVDNVAMKSDLEAYATKDDIVSFKDEILNSNDKLVKKLDTFLTEQASTRGALHRHETRITHLERKVGIASIS